MRTPTSCALTLALALGAVPAAAEAAADTPRPRLAVLRAENRAANAWWDEVGGERAQQVLIARLAQSGQYRVMARRQLADALAELRFWLTGELSPAGAVRLGRELDVRYLVASTLVEFGTGARGSSKRSGRKLLGLGGPKNFKTQVILRLIDAEDGRTIWLDSRRAETSLKDALSVPVEEAVRVEDVVFEQTLAPMLEELAGLLVDGSIEGPAEAQPTAAPSEDARPVDEGPPGN